MLHVHSTLAMSNLQTKYNEISKQLLYMLLFPQAQIGLYAH